MAPLPSDYLHRIYAGVLGKLIGVYLGRPFENWTYQEILRDLGPIDYYVHERLGLPLVVIDDDVSGTFAFVRALEEHGINGDLKPEHVGKTWLNNVIEGRTIFWWGGHGISTEHTTFNNLKNGVKAPMSGSIQKNGRVLAEQIGAQIFIDGWALVAPGNPALAARLAEAAALVSHDGVAVHAAKLWAAMEAEAFVSNDVDHLLDTGLSFVPPDSHIVRLIKDIRAWAKEDKDWHKTRQRIEDNYGYDKYGGICHMVPNHGIMIMALIYGGHDFSLAMHIINTSGWDTDCNSGNVGCLVGIMNGLTGFENGPDWRGPLADRAIISTADNGYSINNAVRISYDLANMALELAGEKRLEPPKNGAQFHFSLPGSVQGFQTTAAKDVASISQGQDRGIGALGIRLHELQAASGAVEVLTDTFTPSEIIKVKRDYEMMASPLVYPGQRVSALLCADESNTGKASVCIRVKAYGANDELITVDSDSKALAPGSEIQLEWVLPQSLENKPIQQLGVACTADSSLDGTIWLHSIKYDGTPNMTLKRPVAESAELFSGTVDFWQRAWVSSVEKVHTKMGPSFYIAHGNGEGLFTHGTRDWKNYKVTAPGFTVNLGAPCGIVVRGQGMKRYYALVLQEDKQLAIVKVRDDERIVLAKTSFNWEMDTRYEMVVSVEGNRICGRVQDIEVTAVDEAAEYTGGAIGFVLESGSLSADSLSICPI